MEKNCNTNFKYLQDALDVIGTKWRVQILYSICVEHNTHFREIERSIEGLSTRMRPRTQTEVEITDRKAYKFIFEFWWTFLGMAMTKGELAKAMHPMIAFVNKMAGSVERLIADGVEYVEVPVLG